MADLSPLEFSFGENVARFSDLLHSDRDAYQALYDRYADLVGGFTGLYRIPIIAGNLLTVMEDDGEAEWGGEGVNDWIEVTERIMGEITRRAMLGAQPRPIDDKEWLRGVIKDVLAGGKGGKDWSPRPRS